MEKIYNIKRRLFIKFLITIVFLLSSLVITASIINYIIPSKAPFIVITSSILLSCLNIFMLHLFMKKCSNFDKEHLEFEKCIV